MHKIMHVQCTWYTLFRPLVEVDYRTRSGNSYRRQFKYKYSLVRHYSTYTLYELYKVYQLLFSEKPRNKTLDLYDGLLENLILFAGIY
jgi:hypothetical protein